MKRLLKVSAMALTGLLASASAMAEQESGVVCQPKTNTDAGRIRYSGNRVMNTSTTATATVMCTMGTSSEPHVTALDNNGAPGANIVCTGFYYVPNILSNAGNRSSSATGLAALNWTSVNIQEVWTAQCVIPVATGAAENQMSSVDIVR